MREGWLSMVYDYVMLIAIVVGIFPLMFRTQYKFFWYCDIISGVCFIIDYLLRWVTCDLRDKKRRWYSFVLYPFKPIHTYVTPFKSNKGALRVWKHPLCFAA